MLKVKLFLLVIISCLAITSFSLKTFAQQTSGGSSSSSSGGVSQSTISDGFSGVWIAKVKTTTTVNGVVVREGTRGILLKLCVHEGILKGLINHPGVIKKGLITAQNVKSPTEVEVTYKDKKNNTGTLNLTLVGSFQLNGAFSNGISFEARKASQFHACEVLKTCNIENLFD